MDGAACAAITTVNTARTCRANIRNALAFTKPCSESVWSTSSVAATAFVEPFSDLKVASAKIKGQIAFVSKCQGFTYYLDKYSRVVYVTGPIVKYFDNTGAPFDSAQFEHYCDALAATAVGIAQLGNLASCSNTPSAATNYPKRTNSKSKLVPWQIDQGHMCVSWTGACPPRFAHGSSRPHARWCVRLQCAQVAGRHQ